MGNPLILGKTRVTNSIRLNFLVYWVIHVWNASLSIIVGANYVVMFKQLLKNYCSGLSLGTAQPTQKMQLVTVHLYSYTCHYHCAIFITIVICAIDFATITISIIILSV